jgi:hypothetical protein
LADKKITELPNITGADLANADEFAVVDITASQTKAITFGELKTAVGTDFVSKAGSTMTGSLVLNADPTASLQAASKQYVDTIAAAGLHYHDPCRVESSSNLTVTYNNGTAGVGATLTNNSTQVALALDGVTLSSGNRVLVKGQTAQAQNGVYTVTNTGSGSTNWVLTRATDADSYGPSDPDSFGQGDAFFVEEGNTGAGNLDVMNTVGVITFGTTAIVFVNVSASAVYSAGTGVTLTGTQFSIGQDVATTSTPTFGNTTVTGNLGIGTSSPSAPLVVNATSASEGLRVQRDGVPSQYLSINEFTGGEHRIYGYGNKPLDIGSTEAVDIRLRTNSVIRMVIDSSGNIGIGTSSPARTLDVNGTMRLANGSGVEWGGVNETIVGDTAGALIYKVGGAEVMRNTATGVDVTGNATFADNGKAIFGAGSDLEIYHNGTDSFIDEKGAGWLYIRGNNTVIGKYTGETYMKGIADGAVELYHNNVKKIETTSTGITVTGSIVADNIGGGSLAPVSPSGTSAVNFTSIPAGVRQVTVMLDELSMSGSNDLLIQLGDSGGIETSGYISRSVWTNASESTAGMIIRVANSGYKWTGTMTFTRVHTTNRFVQTHTVVDPDSNQQQVGAGSKTLSAELTQLRVVPTGSNTFDNGSVSIAWSY